MEERVKKLCRERRKTLTELANDMGITKESLTRALKGNTTLKTIQKIAKALGIEVWELFADSLPVKPSESFYGVIYVAGQPRLINSIDELDELLKVAKLGRSQP